MPTASAAEDRASPSIEEVLLDLLPRARLVKSFQLVNGLKPELLAAALAGERVGTIIHGT